MGSCFFNFLLQKGIFFFITIDFSNFIFPLFMLSKAMAIYDVCINSWPNFVQFLISFSPGAFIFAGSKVVVLKQGVSVWELNKEI